jgi:hypothetical protein
MDYSVTLILSLLDILICLDASFLCSFRLAYHSFPLVMLSSNTANENDSSYKPRCAFYLYHWLPIIGSYSEIMNHFVFVLSSSRCIFVHAQIYCYGELSNVFRMILQPFSLLVVSVFNLWVSFCITLLVKFRSYFDMNNNISSYFLVNQSVNINA